MADNQIISTSELRHFLYERRSSRSHYPQAPINPNHTAAPRETMSLLSSLCRSNLGILRQKLGLIEALVTKFGAEEAKVVYKTTCPIVQASIGQHVRHSMDHLERAAHAATNAEEREIHYDVRTRGVADENDMDAAASRILRVEAQLEGVTSNPAYISVTSHPIRACFMLSGDSELEYNLPSTVARELGFAAHHAIHHLAMVRIIATKTVGLSDLELPQDFGRAPSTVNYDQQVAN